MFAIPFPLCLTAAVISTMLARDEHANSGSYSLQFTPSDNFANCSGILGRLIWKCTEYLRRTHVMSDVKAMLGTNCAIITQEGAVSAPV